MLSPGSPQSLRPESGSLPLYAVPRCLASSFSRTLGSQLASLWTASSLPLPLPGSLLALRWEFGCSCSLGAASWMPGSHAPFSSPVPLPCACLEHFCLLRCTNASCLASSSARLLPASLRRPSSPLLPQGPLLAACLESRRAARRAAARCLASPLDFSAWQATHSVWRFVSSVSPPPSTTARMWSASHRTAVLGSTSSRSRRRFESRWKSSRSASLATPPRTKKVSRASGSGSRCSEARKASVSSRQRRHTPPSSASSAFRMLLLLRFTKYAW
mmetsp:Transcript_14505/g.40062  ORF Transcript_14505/g.40062 Transcript_14505/m.40062 type:complete len:273 (+) Transcript_14505:382-1200(+)